MKEAMLRYQTGLILGFHLISMGLALFLLRLDASLEAMLELFVVIIGSHVLARFIGQTLSPLIRYYRSLGHFAVIHRLGALSSILLIDIVVIAAALVWGIMLLRGDDLTFVLTISYLIMIIVPSLTKLLQVFLEPDARDDFITIALIRRAGMTFAMAFLLLLLFNDFDVLLMAPLLAVIQLVIFILVVRIRFRYSKEITYRRQYEDSGHHESLLQLFKVLSLQALSMLPVIVLQAVATALLYLFPQLLMMVEQPVLSTIFQSLIVTSITAGVVRVLFRGITPPPAHLQAAEATNNSSRLRTEITLWLERGSLVEGVLAVIAIALLGVILPIVVEMDYPVIILSVVTGYLLGIDAYLSHVFSRLSIIASTIISLTAILFLIAGSFYYAVYFGYVGILISAVVTLVYLYAIAYVWAFKEYEMEGKPHGVQLLKVAGLVVLSGSILVALGVVLPPLLDPLQTGLRVIAVSSIILLVEVVVMYAYIRATGLSRYLLDAKQIKQQFDTIYITTQEEEAIW